MSDRASWAAVDSAYKAFYGGRWKEAVELFSKILSEKPEHTGYLTTLGECELRLGMAAEAVGHFREAIKQSPEPSRVAFRRFITAARLYFEKTSVAATPEAQLLAREVLSTAGVHLNSADIKSLRCVLGSQASEADEELFVAAARDRQGRSPLAVGNAPSFKEFEVLFTPRYKPSIITEYESAVAVVPGWVKNPCLEFYALGDLQWSRPLPYRPRKIFSLPGKIVCFGSDWRNEMAAVSVISQHGEQLETTKFLAQWVTGCETPGTEAFIVVVGDGPSEGCLLRRHSSQVFERLDLPFVVSAAVSAPQGWWLQSFSGLALVNSEGVIEEVWHPGKIKVSQPTQKRRHPLAEQFEILGIEPTGNKESIRRAYLAKARRWHPDINEAPDATEVMKRLNAAYSTLSSAEIREIGGDSEITYDDTIVSLATSRAGTHAYVSTRSGCIYYRSNGSWVRVHDSEDLDFLAVLETSGEALAVGSDALYIVTPETLTAIRLPDGFQRYFARATPLDWVGRFATYVKRSSNLYVVSPSAAPLIQALAFRSPIHCIHSSLVSESLLVAAGSIVRIPIQEDTRARSQSLLRENADRLPTGGAK